MVYLKSVENVITLGKSIGLLFLFCLPLLSILFLKTKMNDLARPVMGTIFLVYHCIVAIILVVCIIPYVDTSMCVFALSSLLPYNKTTLPALSPSPRACRQS